MRKTWILIASIAIIMASGCHAGLAPLAAQAKGMELSRLRQDAMPATPEAELTGITPTQQPTPHLATIEPRKVIYTGEFEIAVADPRQAIARTKTLTEQMGGYMQRMTQQSIVVRVPAEKFDQAVAALEKIGTVFSRDIRAQDVTEEHIDLQIRLANAKALLGKLNELLGKAKTVKEALAVEKEIARVRTELERLTGRLNRLTHQVSFATITVRFRTSAEAPKELRASLPFWWLSRLGLKTLMSF